MQTLKDDIQASAVDEVKGEAKNAGKSLAEALSPRLNHPLGFAIFGHFVYHTITEIMAYAHFRTDEKLNILIGAIEATYRLRTMISVKEILLLCLLQIAIFSGISIIEESIKRSLKVVFESIFSVFEFAWRIFVGIVTKIRFLENLSAVQWLLRKLDLKDKMEEARVTATLHSISIDDALRLVESKKEDFAAINQESAMKEKMRILHTADKIDSSLVESIKPEAVADLEIQSALNYCKMHLEHYKVKQNVEIPKPNGRGRAFVADALATDGQKAVIVVSSFSAPSVIKNRITAINNALTTLKIRHKEVRAVVLTSSDIREKFDADYSDFLPSDESIEVVDWIVPDEKVRLVKDPKKHA